MFEASLDRCLGLFLLLGLLILSKRSLADIYLCVSHVCLEPAEDRRGPLPPGSEAIMPVLGIEPWSSARAASALNC